MLISICQTLRFSPWTENGCKAITPILSRAGSELIYFNPLFVGVTDRFVVSCSLNAVIAGGKAHGAQTEDIYGCLYFYLSDQLRLFAERIQQFRISFNVLGLEASMLSNVILDNQLASYGIPASIRFDRIEVSNLMDGNYLGIDGVLTAWAPLLGENRCATIVGYFMNWVALGQPDGHVSNAGAVVCKELLQCLVREGRVSIGGFPVHFPR
jgi:hypothetical protein